MTNRKHFTRFIGLGLLCLIFMPALAVSAQSNPEIIRWLAPQYIAQGWFPSISVDETDSVYIGWHGGTDDNELLDLLWLDVLRPGETFGDPVDVVFAAEGGYTVRSALDVSTDGVVYAMYRTHTSHALSNAPAERADSAQEWKQVAHFQNAAYYLDMVVDRNNVIHAISSEQGVNLQIIDTGKLAENALRERFPCAFCSDLIYRRSADGGRTWTSPINLSESIDGSERPDIFEGHSGRLYVTWDEGADWYISQGKYQDVRFIYSDDGGQSWSDVIILSGNELRHLHPTQFSLTEMNNGNLMAVWRYGLDTDRRIYFQISEDLGQTWTEPEPIPYIVADNVQDSELDKYELITDLTGAVHLFAVGFDEASLQGPALYHITYIQGSWLIPSRIYYDPDVKRPEWPSAAVGPRNDLHVAWFVRVGDGVNAADVGTLQVYYSSRTPTLPDRPVLVAYAPTATPVPLPTRIPTFEPTATILPTLAPLDTNTNVKINRDQYASQTLVGALLAVGLLCGGLLVVTGFRRRR